MTDSKPPTFWQTLPGILTALAGVLSAAAALIIAVDQIRARSPQPEAAHSAAPSTTPVPSSSAARTTTSPVSSASAAPTVLVAGPPAEARFESGAIVFGVLTAALEPFNADTRLVNLRLRVTNNTNALDRSYYSELRLVSDGLPQAPESPPLEQIEAHSVKDLTYTFRVPVDARTLRLRVTRKEEAVEIPLEAK